MRLLTLLCCMILTVALLTPFAAHAENSIQPQLDAAVASVTRTVTQMSDQIMLDEQRISQLTQQLAVMTTERDKLKADTASKDATKP